MAANVGLSTPRGSGTSGYVQRNLSLLKPRDAGFGAPYPPRDALPPRQRKPDQQILQHDRKREIEIKVLGLRDRLEDEGELDEDGIEAECGKLREKLTQEMEKGQANGGALGKGKGLKMHQVHELAEVKMRESERLRRALGLKEGEYVNDNQGKGKDGAMSAEEAEHPMARQERRKREDAERREREEVERLEKRKAEDGRREAEREEAAHEERRKARRDKDRQRERDRGDESHRDRDRDRERRRSRDGR